MIFVYSTNEKYFSIGNYFILPILTLLIGFVSICKDLYRNNWRLPLKKTILLYVILYVYFSAFILQKECKLDVIASYTILIGMLYVMTYKELSEIDIKYVFYSYILSALILALILLTQMRFPLANPFRFTIFYTDESYYDVNFIGGYLTVPAILTFYKGLIQKKVGKKILFQLSTGVLFTAMLLTGSRGAFLGFFCGIFILVKNRRMIVKGILLLLLLLLLLPLLPDVLYERLFESSYDDGSNELRMLDWLSGLNSFYKSPIFGNGFDWPSDIIYRELHLTYTAHNTYIVLLMHYGLIGILPFLLYVFPVWYKLMKDKTYKVFLASFSSLFLIVLMIEASLSIVFFMPFTVLMVLYNYKRRNLTSII